MADVISGYDTFQGLLIPDPRITGIDRSQSVLTEAGPRPGVPEPQVQTNMVLRTLGSQAAGKELRVKTSKAGMPGVDKAGFIWQYNGDDNWRGWDVPTVITHWEAVRFLDGSLATATGASNLDCITLADGTVLVASEVSATSPSTQDMVQVNARDPDSGSWGSAVTVYTQGGGYSTGRGAHPCLVQLSSGRVLLWHWVELSSGNMQIRQHYSDDSGATWSVGSKFCLPAVVEYQAETNGGNKYDTMGRLRAAVLDAEVLLMASLRSSNNGAGPNTVRDVFRQYASSDLGATFTQVDESTFSETGYRGKHQDVLAHAGRLIIAWCSGSPNPATVVLASAWRAFTTVDAVGITGAETSTNLVNAASSGEQVDDSDLALVGGDDGALYLLHRATTDGTGQNNEGLIARSIDAGASWAYLGQSAVSDLADSSLWWTCGDASTHPRDFAACWVEGRILVAHHWDANPGNEDNSIGALYLGGASTVTMPSYGDVAPNAAQRVSWSRTWLPLDLPDAVGWSATGAGTGALTAGAANISTSSSTLYYDINPAGTVDEGLILRLRLSTTSGGSLITDQIALRLRLADGTNDYDISVRCSASAVRIYDNNAGAQVGSNITVDTTAGVELLIAMSAADLATWYRAAPDNLPDRAWSEGPGSGSLTNNTSTPDSNNLIRWGHLSGSTSESDWFELHYVTDEFTGAQLLAFTNPDDLFPRNYADSGVFVEGGTRVKAVDGPTLVGDLWNIDTRADYAVDRVMPLVAASPRIAWRSTSTAEHKLALALEAGGAASLSGNVIIGIAVYGANWRTCSLEGDTGGGSWSTIETFDAAKGLASMAYTRSGNSLEAGSGSTDQPYLYFNEAREWTADLGSSKLRRVQWSTEGKWDDAGKKARLFIEGVDGTEPASGTMSLWPRDFTLVARVNSDLYAGYRLVIDSQSTVDGYFEVGTLVAGPIVVFGNVYSWGRVIDLEPNVEVARSADGVDRTRKRGPAQRGVSLAWEDGIDLTEASGDEPTPDFLTTSTAAGSEGAASVGDTPLLLQGLVHAQDGPRVPMVYLPRVPKGATSADAHVLNRRDQHVFGRLLSNVRVESVQGEELADEVVRVASLQLREIV